MTNTAKVVIPRPFIKWAGGKQSISTKIIEFFPTNYERYYEPFIGGGSVLYNTKPQNAVISDYNTWLIDTYLAVRNTPEELITLLEQIPNDKETYLKYRSMDIKNLNMIQRAANFIYLNKTCFRGLFRVNMKGQFNVPYGDYNRRYFDKDEILATSNFLKRITIRRGDYERSLFDISPDDFVYIDPPYYKQGDYSDFNRYTVQKFSIYEHIRLASFCNELNNRGIRFVQSNSNTSFIKELYKNYEIIEISNRREINLNSKKRSIKELLIKNF